MAKSYVYSTTDPTAPPIRGSESQWSIWYSQAQTAYNAWQPRWGANTANALCTGILSSLASLAGAIVPSKVYDYYRQQEQLYIENAAEEARRIKLKGDIELRNLEIAHTLNQGKQELAAAGSGTNMVTNVSGSALDMLVQNHKYNMMDERTSSLETLWEVSNAKRAGYIQALQVAGQAMQTAYTARNRLLSALGALIKNTAIPLLKDQQSYITQAGNLQMQTDKTNQGWNQFLEKYGEQALSLLGNVMGASSDADNLSISGSAVESSSSAQQETGITSYLMSEQGIPFADPVTGINVHNSDGISLPLIQVNVDGSVRTDYSPLKIND